MKKLNSSEARKANGGGRYFCKVCGYSNDKYSKVFWHIAGNHVREWGRNFRDLVKAVF